MPKKILIIEDHRDLARLLETHLQDLSFQVDLSFDGRAGIAKAQTDIHDLITLFKARHRSAGTVLPAGGIHRHPDPGCLGHVSAGGRSEAQPRSGP
jgi:DNA-binding NtrC family response regulator